VNSAYKSLTVFIIYFTAIPSFGLTFQHEVTILLQYSKGFLCPSNKNGSVLCVLSKPPEKHFESWWMCHITVDISSLI